MHAVMQCPLHLKVFLDAEQSEAQLMTMDIEPAQRVGVVAWSRCQADKV
jgi:hypothetical protein